MIVCVCVLMKRFCVSALYGVLRASVPVLLVVLYPSSVLLYPSSVISSRMRVFNDLFDLFSDKGTAFPLSVLGGLHLSVHFHSSGFECFLSYFRFCASYLLFVT